LRNKLLGLHSLLCSGSGQRREVHVCGDILLARRLVWIRADRVLANGFQCSAMTSGELLLASVTIVDGNDESSLQSVSHRVHILLCEERHFDPLPYFRMHGIAVKKFKLLRRRRCPSLDEASAAHVYAKRSWRADNLDGQGIEEFVGEDDRGNVRVGGNVGACGPRRESLSLGFGPSTHVLGERTRSFCASRRVADTVIVMAQHSLSCVEMAA
jgi:hypothetical protein